MVSLCKKFLLTCIIIFSLFSSGGGAILASEDKVTATISVTVSTTVQPSGHTGKPIKGARVIVINSLGEIIGHMLTSSEGIANIKVTVPKDLRFPMKNMGEVTVIAIANGYNEYINFSVPINEFGDKRASVFLPLWEVDPTTRNEPQFNGNYHRFTVFKMLNFYADKIGLVRQNLKDKSIEPPPWSPDIIQ